MPFIILKQDGKRFGLDQAVFTEEEIERLRGDGHVYVVQNVTNRQKFTLNKKRRISRAKNANKAGIHRRVKVRAHRRIGTKGVRAHGRNMAVKTSYRQTIETKYHGPTNSRGSRFTATASGGAGRITVPYDHALNTDKNHEVAAQKLIEKLGWGGDWIGGQTKSGSYVFVDRGK